MSVSINPNSINANSSNRRIRRASAAATLIALAPALVANAADGDSHGGDPQLAGRAVLPVETYAPGPPAGAFYTGPPNGIQFPLPSQPVAGISGIVDGRTPGEYLAMPDNGFGNKANSPDFLIRAYYITPDFPESDTGTIEVGDFISFADPEALIGFPIVNANTPERLLTGADIDPESIQRGRHGDFWVGDEFGPWILHFDGSGRLLEPPIRMPDGLVSPANSLPDAGPVTINNSRGLEAMAITANGTSLVFVLEGAVPGDDPSSRRVYELDLDTREFTRHADYRVETATNFVSDAQSVGGDHLLVIERDGAAALFRRVYLIDLDGGAGDGTVSKREVVDLAAIPDPDGVSLPALHEGDVGLGDPFRVTCESIEALHVLSHAHLLLGCDNNFPNVGRNPQRADDNELIVVKVPGL
jgi:hypothetical protein